MTVVRDAGAEPEHHPWQTERGPVLAVVHDEPMHGRFDEVRLPDGSRAQVVDVDAMPSGEGVRQVLYVRRTDD